MQRAAWTDERLDDMSERMDTGFERIDRDIRDLRSEMRTDIGGLRAEMREEIGGLRTLTWRFGGGILGAVVVSAILHGI
jgi:hypothetical protein